jgi:hypothetical protein
MTGKPQHVNPGLDTTINPVVIDDSYREKKVIPDYTAAALSRVRDACMFKTQLALVERENEFVLEFLQKVMSMEVVSANPGVPHVSYLCIDGIRRFEMSTVFGDDGKITMTGKWIEGTP